MHSDRRSPNSVSLYFSGRYLGCCTPWLKASVWLWDTSGPPKISPALWNSMGVDSEFLRDQFVHSRFTDEGSCSLSNQISPSWACLQVKSQSPGPSEVLLCPPGQNTDIREGRNPLISPCPSVTQQPLVLPLAWSSRANHSRVPTVLLWQWSPPAQGPPMLPTAPTLNLNSLPRLKETPYGLLVP